MTAIRHKVQTKLRAIELREAGWSINEVRTQLAREGVDPPPSANTIWCWTNVEMDARQRAHKRRSGRLTRLRSANFRWPGVRGPEWKVGRMQALRDGGLSCAAIASVMTIDFPDTPLTEHQVRGALTGGHMPRNLKATA